MLLHVFLIKKKILNQGQKYNIKNTFTLSDPSEQNDFFSLLKSKLNIIYFLDYGSKSLSYLNIFLKFNSNSIIAIANKEMIIAGGETAGIPYAAYISEKLKKPMVYIRKKPKGFGINKQIEGDFHKNQSALLVEDLATDGGSKITFINAMREAELEVKDIFVIFYYDIFDFKKSDLFKLNVKIHSLCTWKDIINYIEKNNIYTEKEILDLKIFLSNPNKWRENNG